MSGKCGSCDRVIASNEFGVKCVSCNVLYHAECTSMKCSQNFTKTKLKSWICDNCKKESVSGESNEDLGNEGTKTILEALNNVELKINRNIDEKVNDVKMSIDSLKADLGKINSRVSTLEVNQGELHQRYTKLEQDNMKLSAALSELRKQQRADQQHDRCEYMEIVGVPVTQGEDTLDILEKLARAINVPFKKEDISMAHRLRLFSKKHAVPPIVVHFISRYTRESWLSASKKRRGVTASEISASLPASPVFCNEQLIPHNKALLGRARRLMKERKLYFAGYYNGKVLIKPRERDESILVTEITDLDQYDR